MDLGIFLCWACAAIHRSMATEPSVVRLWDPDIQPIRSFSRLLEVGNQVSNKYWEFLLPSDFNRPSREETPRLNSFIQDKYVVGRWADPDRTPPLDAQIRKAGANLPDLSLDLTWCREDLDLPRSVGGGLQSDGPYLGLDPDITHIFA
jgi:hypothetical protein